MSRTVTLADIHLESRERADKVGSGFIQKAELTRYINASYTFLYDLLVGAYGNDYYLKSYDFTTDGIKDSYALPTDFYKMIGVDYMNNSDTFLSLKPFQFNERAKYQLGTYWSALVGRSGPRYQLRGDDIAFMPKADGSYNIRLWYIPACPRLVSDTDKLDGINGWEEFVIVDAAIKMLAKEETDTAELQKEKNELIIRINTMAENRDAGHSFRVTDVSNDYGFINDSDAYRY